MSITLSEKEIAPLNYFLHSYGPASAPTMHLGWVFASIVSLVFFIIAGLLIGGLLRKRGPDTGKIDAAHNGLRWLYIGTGISTCLLLGMAVYALFTLNEVAKPPQAPALTLTVTGYDWWWKVEYDDPALNFVTANEIHIPVGVPVLVKLKSADVIHAFWVPVLAGKTQMIPGQINHQWLQADVSGVYRGECTQYCGLQHAHMALEVIAQSPAEFQQWQTAQRRPAAPSSANGADTGRKLFMERCSGCHTIRGTEAVGAHAPDLTHLKSRRLIAGGTFVNTAEQREKWVTHAQELKPGARMPSMVLSPSEMTALSVFLSTLD